MFGVFKYNGGSNLCSHVAQRETVNKKSNVSAISYYIYIDYIDIDIDIYIQSISVNTK